MIRNSLSMLKFSNLAVVNHFHRIYKCRGMSSTNFKPFEGFMDRFNGVFVELSEEICHKNDFDKKVDDSLSKWKNESKRCVWFKINTENSYAVPLLAEKGFNFHHARKDFVVMYKWLPEDSKPNLPPSCHTNVGVGAMVFNERNQVLAVSEKHYNYPHWKLPGGYVEHGEDLVDAAKREVREETGVEAVFQSLVTFRHTHNMMFGNSDIYILLMMKALSDQIVVSEREMKDCKWMDVEEYCNHPHVHEFNRFVIKKALDYKTRKVKLDFPKKTVKWATYVREFNYLLIEDREY